MKIDIIFMSVQRPNLAGSRWKQLAMVLKFTNENFFSLLFILDSNINVMSTFCGSMGSNCCKLLEVKIVTA